ncbi:MAG: ABC transporter substrate-binding protein [Saccharofermentanales bacterium]
MINSKKILIILVAAIMLTVALFGCTPKPTTTTSTSSNPASEESSQESETVSEESSAVESTDSSSLESSDDSSNVTSEANNNSIINSNASSTITGSKVSSSSSASSVKPSNPSDVSGLVKDMKGRTVVFHNFSSGVANGANDKHIERLKARIASVEKQYNCKIVWTDNANWGSISKTVMAGQPSVDIWETMWNQQLAESFLPCYVAGLFQPLEPLKCFNFADKKYQTPIGNTMVIDGMHYGISMDETYLSSGFQFDQMMFYRYDVLKKAGVTDAMMPDTLAKNGQWTWDNFKKICEKVTAAGLVSIYDWAGTRQNITNLYQVMCYTYGTDIIIQDPATKKVTFNAGSTKALSALTLYTSFVKNNIIKAPDPSKGLPEQMSDNVAFQVTQVSNAKWGFPRFGTEIARNNFGMVYLPKVKASDSFTVIASALSQGWSIPYGVKNPKDAATVMQALIPLELNPTAAKAEVLMDYDLWLPSNPIMAESIKRIEKEINDIAYTSEQKYFVTDLSIGCGVADDWLKHVQKIATGQENAASVIKANTSKYNNLLKDIYTLR